MIVGEFEALVLIVVGPSSWHGLNVVSDISSELKISGKEKERIND